MRYAKFYRYLLPYWKKEALILFFSITGIILGLVNPYLAKLVIDKAYRNKDLKLFIVLAAAAGLVFILNTAINGLSSYLNRYIKLKIKFALSRKIFKKLQGLNYSFFQDTSGAEHLYKINYDIEEASRFISDTLPQAISFLPKALLILAVIAYLNWKIALFALAFTPLIWYLPYYFNRRLKARYREWIENSQGIFKRLEEVFSHIQLIKASGNQKLEERGYISALAKNIRFSLKNSQAEARSSFGNILTGRLILGIILVYGSYQIIQGRMTLGNFTAIAIYLTQLFILQSSFAVFFQQLSLGGISCERLDKIIEAKAECIQNHGAKDKIFTAGSIEFKNAHFGYSRDKIILKNLNFHINGSSCIALAGPSGAGKTTIINLFLKLYKLGSGIISVDGSDIYDINTKSFYEQTGVVLQEPFLWNDTIENNIRYGRKNALPQEISEAARITRIDDFISGLPKGYKTIIGENACKISEGQKQRLAIARAVIKKPKILILDEAFSSVGARLQAEIFNNIRSSLKASTIIIISHSPSVLKMADLVYFLSMAGKLDVATHDRLLENTEYQTYLNSYPEKEPAYLASNR